MRHGEKRLSRGVVQAIGNLTLISFWSRFGRTVLELSEIVQASFAQETRINNSRARQPGYNAKLMSLGQVNRGLNLLGQGAATAARMAKSPGTPPGETATGHEASLGSDIAFAQNTVALEPKLAVSWGDFHQGFFSSVRALFSGPFSIRKFVGGEYFRDCWVERRVPTRAVVAAALWHVVFLISPFSLLTAVVRHNSAFDNTQLTWLGPIEDFPAIEITAKPRTKPISPKAPSKPNPKSVEAPSPNGADAFHPRQRIVIDPARPNHPRQTLINPKAPQIAPAILPALPNIVQLQAAPARPRIEISADAMAKLHPREHRAARLAAALPDAPTLDQKPAELNLTASTNGPARPKLDLNAGAAPRVAERTRNGEVTPAPELDVTEMTAAKGNPTSLIALSASPAPPKADVVVPEGNLAARVSMSPEGKKAGRPGGTPNAESAGNAASKGDVAVSISDGNPQPKSTVSGIAGHPSAKLNLPSSRELMARPEPKADGAPAEKSGPANFAALPPGAKPEQIFAAKRVYTLAVNMANLTSASGSWILHFAELGSGDSATPLASADLSMPVPVRKVDPKYPPELIEQNVQGEVALYGIIRANGSVDSIQVAKSLDPQLDANAKSAFTQWKFTPAARAGTPVDVEVIAHIPFKIRDDR